MFGIPFPGAFGHFAYHDDDFEDEFEEQLPPQDVDNKELYEILEIPPQSDIPAVKQAYKTLAKKYHPDRPGGNQEKFQLIQKANEVLSDPEKKKIYDKFGKQGLLKQLNVKNPQFKKCEPHKLNHKITLKDVALGAYHKKTLNDIRRSCEECQGQGGKQSVTCSSCKGNKIVQMVVEVQPGINMLQQAPCPDCKGKGKAIAKEDECKSCKGQGNVEGVVEIEIPIEKGVPDGYCVKLYGKGNSKPGYETGDVHAYLEIEQHPKFIRKGTDLFYQHTISLKEALVGVNIQLETLDEKVINITTDKVIKPNQILTIKEKGLPTFKDELHFGDLHVQFYIEFPKELDQDVTKKLAEILPGPSFTPKQNSIKLQEFKFDEFEKHQARIEENEDDEFNQNGIECSIF
ncbi:unnamed protein product (macronuclear) [Paramecium tetraurelia]|uniref:Uncharacterized protein n=1 Tax=Paramecium tetraurelia TaxID=5888 RepID=A0E069_PARTE|nr:uncharacterized protein GSPATT00021854001 [Paramecium tetraurelia]CAK88686.1 unnamed protein product [Paramecium tetraurelia]|eukprot:XP_001456083.1 hypothetical protein (macronuclear) [Paramecium tetraurelia strain d4-2]